MNTDLPEPPRSEHCATQTKGAPAWAPFAYRAFAIIWLATVVSNIGYWMYDVATGWLMVSLDANPLTVSMVQVANTLPMFLFAIPAGAWIDIIDQRRFLIAGEAAVTLTSTAFAVLVWLHLIGPTSLLIMSFLVTVGSAFTAPAWQAIVSQLVPKPALQSAVAANSVGINISRAVGPALGGLLVVSLGLGAPFWINAVSNIGVIAALIWWRPPSKPVVPLPAESFSSGVRTGLRHARYNPYLAATLIRTIGFFLFASAYWALLPLVANRQIAGGAALYGVLLGAIGAAAVGTAFVLGGLRSRLGANSLLAVASIMTGAATALFAVAHRPLTAVVASLLAGSSWICAVSSLNVSAQISLPDWVRGRGLAMYVTVMFGALTAGSVLWGQLATCWSIPASLLIAAVGAVLAVPMTWRWKLQLGENVDFSPSMRWPAPVTVRTVEPDRGPVLITIEYRINPNEREAFLNALARSSSARRRDGAYNCGIFEDPNEEGRFVETFMTDSWLEHLWQHRRVTKTDEQDLLYTVRRFQLGEGPKATHLIAAARR
jgi:predicted MFS family arabinose efflux permease